MAKRLPETNINIKTTPRRSQFVINNHPENQTMQNIYSIWCKKLY